MEPASEGDSAMEVDAIVANIKTEQCEKVARKKNISINEYSDSDGGGSSGFLRKERRKRKASDAFIKLEQQSTDGAADAYDDNLRKMSKNNEEFLPDVRWISGWMLDLIYFLT